LIGGTPQDKENSNFQVFQRTARSEFERGRKNVAEALDGTMADLPRRLMDAHHRFFTVTAMLKSLDEASVPRAAINLDPIVAEEAIACTSTGIQLGADFCVEHPDAYPLRLFASYGAEMPEVKRRVRAKSSEIEPTFTKLFGQILAAQAVTHSNVPEKAATGIAELKRLNEEAAHKGEEFEMSWLDHALMNAYRRTGDAEVARQFAERISRKLVVRTVLSREM
jgi:hypothetical protein